MEVSGMGNMSKPELKKLIKQIFDTEFRKKEKELKVLTKEDVRKIVRDMMIKQYKFFWEKKSFWANNI